MINPLNTNINVYNNYNNSVSKLLNNISNNVNDTNNDSNDAFKAIFDAATKAITEADSLQKASDTATINFITGEDDNIHSVLLAQEKALIALQFTTEITNKSLEAYNEIMRMQI